MKAVILAVDEPQNPENLQNPFQPVCVSWQEYARRPLPVEGALRLAVILVVGAPQNPQSPQQPFNTSPNLRTYEPINLIGTFDELQNPENLENPV